MNHQGVAKAKPQIRVLGILAKPDAQHIGSILMLALAIEGIRQHKPLPGLAEAFAHVLAQLRDVFIKGTIRSEEHTSELQSLMRISYAVFCLKKKKNKNKQTKN